MQQRIVSVNSAIMSFMISGLLLGFLSIGVATAAPVSAKSGSWVDKDYSIKGEWSIEQRGDQQVISFSDKFKTKGGPDLKVFLSPNSIEKATGKNATNGAVLVAALKNTKGAQEYVLPANVDLNDYASLLIHCEAYSVLWGGTNL